eukprot:16322_6
MADQVRYSEDGIENSRSHEEPDGELHRQIQGVLADLATTKDETETRGNYFGAVRKEREIVGDLRG